MEVRLAANEMLSIEDDAGRITVTCQHGDFWSTQNGGADDYLIQPGLHCGGRRTGVVVIVGLLSASLMFSPAEHRTGESLICIDPST